MKINNKTNEINFTKTLSTFLFIMMIFVAGTNAVTAQEITGQRLKVHMNDGVTFNGRLQDISGNTLTIADPNTGKNFVADMKDIEKLVLIKRPKIGMGILAGMAVGALAGTAICTDEISREYQPLGTIFFGLMGGGAGAITSLFTSRKSKHFNLTTMSDSEIEALLILLKNTLDGKEKDSTKSTGSMKEANLQALAKALETKDEQKTKLNLPSAYITKNGFSLGLSLQIH